MLSQGLLQYFGKAPSSPAAQPTQLKKEYRITAACSVQRATKTEIGYANGAKLTTPERILYFYADNEVDLEMWLRTLQRSISAAIGARATVASASTPISAAGTPVASSEPPSPAVAVVLPDRIDIDGPAETGCEIRIRAQMPASCTICGPSSDALDVLSLAWFRLPADVQPLPGLDADITAVPGYRVITGAVSQTYTITDEDVGKRIGCVCRPAVGPCMRWAVMPSMVVAADVSKPRVTLHLAPHEHSKYCDRRVRVCTAAGKYREGEVLLARLEGPADQLARFRVCWYRSDVIDASQVPQAARSSGAATASTARPTVLSIDGAFQLPDGSPMPPPPPPSMPPSLHPTSSAAVGSSSSTPMAGSHSVSTPSAPGGFTPRPPPGPPPATRVTSVNLNAAAAPGPGPASSATVVAAPAIDFQSSTNLDVGNLLYSLVDARPVSDLPPAPPDHVPSPPIPEIKARLALAAATAPSGATPASAAAQIGPGLLQYPLFKQDIGRMMMAVLVAIDETAPATLIGTRAAGAVLSLPVGPVEAAPPKAREIWIEGSTTVGSLLTGHWYYFGGWEDNSIVSWVAINDDGETSVVKPPTASPASLPPPDPAAPAGSAADDHPRALRLNEALRKSAIKMKVQPVRSDGNEGHTESSRPTPDVE